MKSLLSYFFSHILINILVNYKLITFIIIWRKNYKYAYKYANWIENLRVYEEHRNYNIIHERLLKTKIIHFPDNLRKYDKNLNNYTKNDPHKAMIQIEKLIEKIVKKK